VKVAVFGSSYGQKDIAAFEAIGRAIGLAVAEAGHELIVTTGNEVSLDLQAAHGYQAYAQHGAVRPIQVYRPRTVASVANLPGDLEFRVQEGTRDECKPKAIRAADVVVLLGGGDATRKAAEGAVKFGRRLLPVGALGGAAAEFVATASGDVRDLAVRLRREWSDADFKSALSLLGSSGSDHGIAPSKTKVFICYSHADEEIKKHLLQHLRAAMDFAEFWDDEQIKPGMKWEDEIRAALEASHAALLLVSINFLNSAYCTKTEVPALFRGAQERGLRIFPIILKDCPWKKNVLVKLSDIQALPKNGKPIVGQSNRDRVLTQIAETLAEAIPNRGNGG
jgi:hypothetical protein